MRPLTSSRTNACTTTFSISHARVDSVCDTGMSAPPLKQMLQKQRREEMRKLNGTKGCTCKLSFCFPFKLTWNGCRMFRSADAEVPGGGLSVSVAYVHTSSGLPSTHLLCLCDRIPLLQTQRASHLATSLGARVPHTQVLISMPPDSVEKGRRHLHDRLSLTKRSNPTAEKVLKISGPVHPLHNNP
jgi:hypothetical protein